MKSVQPTQIREFNLPVSFLLLFICLYSKGLYFIPDCQMCLSDARCEPVTNSPLLSERPVCTAGVHQGHITGPPEP